MTTWRAESKGEVARATVWMKYATGSRIKGTAERESIIAVVKGGKWLLVYQPGNGVVPSILEGTTSSSTAAKQAVEQEIEAFARSIQWRALSSGARIVDLIKWQ